MKKKVLTLLLGAAAIAVIGIGIAQIWHEHEDLVEAVTHEMSDSAAVVSAETSGTDFPVATNTDPNRHESAGDSNCQWEVVYVPTENGGLVEANHCVSERPAAHPYTNYTNESLAELAYSDPKAAEILGLRLREADFKAALSLTIRAAALDGGNAEPILYLSDAYPQTTYTDGKPNLETIRVKYVLSAVSDLLGAEHSNVDYWENKVRQEFENPTAKIDSFDEEARKIVAEMQQIENEVKGEKTIKVQGGIG
jgi:hypothetical protein